VNPTGQHRLVRVMQDLRVANACDKAATMVGSFQSCSSSLVIFFSSGARRIANRKDIAAVRTLFWTDTLIAVFSSVIFLPERLSAAECQSHHARGEARFRPTTRAIWSALTSSSATPCERAWPARERRQFDPAFGNSVASSDTN